MKNQCSSFWIIELLPSWNSISCASLPLELCTAVDWVARIKRLTWSETFSKWIWGILDKDIFFDLCTWVRTLQTAQVTSVNSVMDIRCKYCCKHLFFKSWEIGLGQEWEPRFVAFPIVSSISERSIALPISSWGWSWVSLVYWLRIVDCSIRKLSLAVFRSFALALLAWLRFLCRSSRMQDARLRFRSFDLIEIFSVFFESNETFCFGFVVSIGPSSFSILFESNETFVLRFRCFDRTQFARDYFRVEWDARLRFRCFDRTQFVLDSFRVEWDVHLRFRCFDRIEFVLVPFSSRLLRCSSVSFIRRFRAYSFILMSRSGWTSISVGFCRNVWESFGWMQSACVSFSFRRRLVGEDWNSGIRTWVTSLFL